MNTSSSPLSTPLSSPLPNASDTIHIFSSPSPMLQSSQFNDIQNLDRIDEVMDDADIDDIKSITTQQMLQEVVDTL